MRLLWLPGVLRAAGLTVHEVSGWRTRGSAEWGMDTKNVAYRQPLRGVVCHATAGARNGSAAGEIGVLLNGSPSAPPPIAQLYLERDGDWHVVASGRCNHALVGWGGPLKGWGNYQLVGVEAGNDNRGEPWPEAQLDSYERGVSAICGRLGLPASRVAGHYEHQPWPPPPGQTSTKSDPLGINMANFRAAVARLIEDEEGDDMPTVDQVSYGVWSRENPTTGDSYSALLRSRASSAQVAKLQTGQAEIRGLVAAAVGPGITEGVRQAIRDELVGVAETIAPVLADELRGELADLPAEQLEAAVDRALSRTRLAVEPQ